MLDTKSFSKKKILIYGLGKSGISSYLFLKKKNQVFLYDDKKVENKKIKNHIIKKKEILKSSYDYIVISPGIDINECSIKTYLKKNIKKIITDLDVFYFCYLKNKKISITGTNGKSTTAKVLFDALKYQKKDVRLIGNIGNPVLSEKKVKKHTIFVIEISSYQIEYSKYFKSNFAAILNISPDHLERHKTFDKYVKTKFKLIRNQTDKDYAFLDLNNKIIKKEYKQTSFKTNIINVNSHSTKKFIKYIKNPYFISEGNIQNLSFIFALSRKIGLNKKILFKVINNFKNLKYRQELVYKSKNFSIINDSKSTSFASSINILKSLKKVYWIVGGIPKKGDHFTLSKKKCLNIKTYIFGKHKSFFINKLKDITNCEIFTNLENVLIKIIKDLRLDKNRDHITILFSPAAASFDNYKNFEDRGEKFDKLVERINLKNVSNGK